jgi:hypothetical protein
MILDRHRHQGSSVINSNSDTSSGYLAARATPKGKRYKTPKTWRSNATDTPKC